MCYVAMAVPAITVEGLSDGTYHDAFHRMPVTADAIILNDFLARLAGADGHRDISGREGKHILGTLPSLFKIISHKVFVGEMAIYTLCPFFVGGVVPVFVLRVHHVAVCTCFRRTAAIRGRIGHE